MISYSQRHSRILLFYEEDTVTTVSTRRSDKVSQQFMSPKRSFYAEVLGFIYLIEDRFRNKLPVSCEIITKVK